MKTPIVYLLTVSLILSATAVPAADTKDKRDTVVIKPPPPPVVVPKDSGAKRSPVGDKVSDYKPSGPSVKVKEPPPPPKPSNTPKK
jgi:hypothetical protein